MTFNRLKVKKWASAESRSAVHSSRVSLIDVPIIIIICVKFEFNDNSLQTKTIMSKVSLSVCVKYIFILGICFLILLLK